jgi:hypothetical protein
MLFFGSFAVSRKSIILSIVGLFMLSMNGVQSILLVFFISATGVSFAQSQDTLSYPYKIIGIIRDDHGNPLQGVNIASPGDGNMQISDIDGKYFAHIYGPKTPVIFSYYKFVSVLYCPDGRTNVDIVLIPEKRSKSKKKKKYTCP